MSQTFILHADDPGRDQVRANLHAFIDRLPVERAFEVKLAPYQRKRTPKQRAALFAVAYAAIMEHMGLRGEDDRKELHAYFCGEFFGWREGSMTRRRPVRTTTTDENGERDEITTLVALDMYAFIQQRAAEQCIDVPDPDPLWRENARREAA